MTLGVRASAEVAVTAGFVHIQFLEPSGELAEGVNEYLKNMKEVPSPYLIWLLYTSPRTLEDS